MKAIDYIIRASAFAFWLWILYVASEYYTTHKVDSFFCHLNGGIYISTYEGYSCFKDGKVFDAKINQKGKP